MAPLKVRHKPRRRGRRRSGCAEGGYPDQEGDKNGLPLAVVLGICVPNLKSLAARERL